MSKSRKKYQRNWEKLNKDKRSKINMRYRKNMSLWWQEVKSSLSCEKCGEDHPATLEFHHRNPKNKKFSLGEAARGNISKTRVLAEAAKCDVLCANCHRIYHWNKRIGLISIQSDAGVL